MKKQLKKKQWIIICLICATAAAIAVLWLTVWNDTGNTAVYDQLRDEVAPVVIHAPVQEKESVEIPDPEPVVDTGIREPDRDIDFVALFEKNFDILAWISVPGTDIDYPLVRSHNNTDYLTYDAYRNYNEAGAIFMDMANRIDFSDRNTVIYGHNMPNGKMFAGLHKFRDSEFFDQNREVKLYTPEGMRTYEIFAAYTTDDNNILYYNDFTNDAVWEAYIKKVLENKDLTANLIQKQIGLNDQIITLSTCVRNVFDQRFLVQGILIKDAA